MRLLFVTTFHPGARRSGGEVASAEVVDALRAAGHEVVVLGYRRRGSRPPLGRDDVVVADRHIETRGAAAWPAWWMVRAAVGRLPYSAAKYVSPAYAEATRRAVATFAPEIVVLDHAQMAWVLPLLGTRRPVVLLAHNVEHRLYAGMARGPGVFARLNGREARLMGALEEVACRRADAVWALTPDDQRDLDRLGALGRSRALTLTGAPAHPAGGPARHDVALLGSWTWHANAAGLRWFLEGVLPHLPAGLDVRVGGAGARALLEGRAGVTAQEHVADAASFLRDARVVAVPAVAGAGLQVKTLHAIATGRRVVATRVALRGLDDVPATVRSADTPERFAAALLDAVQAGSDADAEADAEATREALAWTERRRVCLRDELADAVGDVAGRSR